MYASFSFGANPVIRQVQSAELRRVGWVMYAGGAVGRGVRDVAGEI